VVVVVVVGTVVVVVVVGPASAAGASASQTIAARKTWRLLRIAVLRLLGVFSLVDRPVGPRPGSGPAGA
jgi:hypothetical protein